MRGKDNPQLILNSGVAGVRIYLDDLDGPSVNINSDGTISLVRPTENGAPAWVQLGSLRDRGQA